MAGEVELNRPYFWAAGLGGHFPADTMLGGAAVSPGAREFCCTMGVIQDFAQGAQDLARLSGLRVSKERLRQITEGEGQAVETARLDGTLFPTWSGEQANLEGGDQTRVYVGGDGVKIRTVTQEEKDHRRRDHVIRRQQRGRAGLERLQPMPPARPGSDDRFKEMKIGVFYDQDKTRVHAFATAGNHEIFGRQLRSHADEIGLELAHETLALVDGGAWLRNQMLKHLKSLDAILLDFYHLSEHIWDTAKCCLGVGEAATAWAQEQLHQIKHVGPGSVLAAIDDLSKHVRGKDKRDSLRLLRQYIVERWEMVDYREALAQGWDIGSGPTEAMCKNLTLRLKRTGMKWDVDNAEGMMTLIALRESRQWRQYWQTQRAA